MDDDALNERIDQILFSEHEEIKKRKAAPYDGVMGTLDEWIPANFHREFHAIRNRLLSTYEHADLLGYIAEMRDMGMRGDRDAGEFAELVSLADDLETASPSGMLTGTYSRPRTPFQIMADVSILAQFQEAVRMGPVEGLALLTDNEHAGQVIHGKKFPGRKPGSYAPWKKWIERKLKKNNALKPAALWELFKAKPLRGWHAVESAKIGQYLESPTGSDDDVTYKRFQDAVGEVRRDLKKG
jgi:hypothetical protein